MGITGKYLLTLLVSILDKHFNYTEAANTMKYFFLVLPEKALSQIFGLWAQITWPKPVQVFINETFSKMYKINEKEMVGDISDYKSLSDFFIRHLKSTFRPVQNGIVHPCDANLSVSSKITSDTLIQNKKMDYFIDDFLRLSVEDEFFEGHQLTYYLSPKDYHRVHVPVDCKLVSVRHISGKLWPVNLWAVKNIKDLFCVNERLVFKFKTKTYTYFLVMVGALNVGSINISVEGAQFFEKDEETMLDIKVSKAQELGYFNMGSSVVLVLPSKAGSFTSEAPKNVQYGQSIV